MESAVTCNEVHGTSTISFLLACYSHCTGTWYGAIHYLPVQCTFNLKFLKWSSDDHYDCPTLPTPATPHPIINSSSHTFTVFVSPAFFRTLAAAAVFRLPSNQLPVLLAHFLSSFGFGCMISHCPRFRVTLSCLCCIFFASSSGHHDYLFSLPPTPLLHSASPM